MKSIWKCRPTVGRHFDVGFINQALLAKVSLLDKAPFCGTSKPQPRPENPTDKMKQMSIMANPIMSGDSLVFLSTAHNRAVSSHVQNRLSTDTCETHRYERMGTWFKLLEYNIHIIRLSDDYVLWELKPRTHSLVANLGVGSHMCPLRGGFGQLTT